MSLATALPVALARCDHFTTLATLTFRNQFSPAPRGTARRSQPTGPHALADPESKLAAFMLASASSMKLESERSPPGNPPIRTNSEKSRSQPEPNVGIGGCASATTFVIARSPSRSNAGTEAILPEDAGGGRDGFLASGTRPVRDVRASVTISYCLLPSVIVPTHSMTNSVSDMGLAVHVPLT